MSRSFTFRATETCGSTGLEFDFICIAYGHDVTVDSTQLFDDIELAIKSSKILPDCIIVISDKAASIEIKHYWDNELKSREAILDRGKRKGLSFIKGYYFYALEDLSVQLSFKSIEGSAQKYNINTDKLIEHGLHFLVGKNKVVQIAPSGHAFRHPSKTVNKIFIQSRELASSEPELKFIANAISLSKGFVLKNAEKVLIDTMGIYNYVREAVKASGGNAEIESFHSYKNIKEMSPPSEPHLCVISASTSGGMAKRFKAQGFKPDNIITLIDKTNVGRTGSVLIPLNLISNDYEQVLGDGTETEIEIVGEHFSSKAKPPRPVILGLLHQPPNLSKLLKDFAKERVRSLNSMLSSGTSSSKLLSIDVSELGDIQDFGDWLQEELAWSLCGAADCIVVADDQSIKIADSAAVMIKEIQKRNELPLVILHSELNSSHLSKAKGVLIISAVAGDGSALREISRDLREFIKTEIPRHFLVGLGVPQTEEAWERLKQFLVRNSTMRSYGFSNWLHLPVGYDGQDNSWKALNELAKKAQVIDLPSDTDQFGVDSKVADASYNSVSDIVAESHNGFLPKTDGKKLQLTGGFVFFGSQFTSTFKNLPPSVIFLTISSVLQRARELKDVKNQLSPTGYESVILAPECFLRFNDNILQACILRAAHSSELDYSASPHHSKLMKEFLSKIFIRHEHAFGSAALEFAAALAVKKLKLKTEDIDELIKASVKNLKNSSSALLGFLLLAANK